MHDYVFGCWTKEFGTNLVMCDDGKKCVAR